MPSWHVNQNGMSVPLNSNQQMQGVSAANAITGEKTYLRIDVAINGDDEIDLAAALLRVLTLSEFPIPTTYKIRVLEYLLARFKHQAAWEKESTEKFPFQQQQAQTSPYSIWHTTAGTSPVSPELEAFMSLLAKQNIKVSGAH